MSRCDRRHRPEHQAGLRSDRARGSLWHPQRVDDLALDAAVRAAFAARDGDALHALSMKHPSLRECAHESPWLHRVGDVDRAKGSVRVLRCAACGGRLYLRRQRTRGAATPGLSIDATLEDQMRHVERSRAERG